MTTGEVWRQGLRGVEQGSWNPLGGVLHEALLPFPGQNQAWAEEVTERVGGVSREGAVGWDSVHPGEGEHLYPGPARAGSAEDRGLEELGPWEAARSQGECEEQQPRLHSLLGPLPWPWASLHMLLLLPSYVAFSLCARSPLSRGPLSPAQGPCWLAGASSIPRPVPRANCCHLSSRKGAQLLPAPPQGPKFSVLLLFSSFWGLRRPAAAAVTNYPRWGLKQQKFVFWRLKSRCRQGCCP